MFPPFDRGEDLPVQRDVAKEVLVASLGDEAFLMLWIAGGFRMQHLDGDLTFEAGVPGLEHFAHASRAEAPHDRVTRPAGEKVGRELTVRLRAGERGRRRIEGGHRTRVEYRVRYGGRVAPASSRSLKDTGRRPALHV